MNVVTDPLISIWRYWTLRCICCFLDIQTYTVSWRNDCISVLTLKEAVTSSGHDHVAVTSSGHDHVIHIFLDVDHVFMPRWRHYRFRTNNIASSNVDQIKTTLFTFYVRVAYVITRFVCFVCSIVYYARLVYHLAVFFLFHVNTDMYGLHGK